MRSQTSVTTRVLRGASALALIASAAAEAWRPPAQQPVWRWAEDNIRLSEKVTSSPGRYRTSLTPYVREILEAYRELEVRDVALCFAAQTSKTLVETISVGYVLCNAAGPGLFVMPSLRPMAESFSENRLQPMITDNPELAKHMLADRHKFKKTEMMFDSMNLALVGANSASNLASRPIKYLWLDEVDKYPKATGDEAGPVDLAMERTKNFPDCKRFMSSTPTTEGGTIWEAFLAGDQRYYYVPCPHCAAHFVMKWEQVKFDKNEPDAETLAAGTYLECPECRGRIEERHKRGMLLEGAWKATNPDAPPSKRSYQLNELYSPFTRWWSLAVKFVEAVREAKHGDVRKLKNFVNSSLAEPWVPAESRMRKVDTVLTLRDDRRRGVVPCYLPMQGLTAGCDTQDDGFYYVIRAWGGGEAMESWLVREGFVESLDVLERILFDDVYCDEYGRRYIVNASFIDSQGHRTSEVYGWCRGLRDAGLRPTKGEQRMATPYKLSKLDRYPDSDRPIPGGLSMYRVNTTFFKDMLSRKMNVNPEDPGAWHLHGDADEEYAKQLCTEYRDEEQGVWVLRKQGLANHYWDAEVLAMAAAEWAGMRHWEPLNDEDEPLTDTQVAQRPAEIPGRRW